ncbi:MAG: exodeoxyribonuclease V subunit gamma [Phycisphaerae bacterium]|nr:exodeoxyribonuclease V subunit gamma [Phycisphaerae bacterium]
MAVQFILGRSGAGKTTLCIKQIIDCLLNGQSENNLVFLVPEQATYQAERAILSNSKIKGYSRLHILSFQRLCYRIFGKNLAARPLTQQARDMIVHRLLCENAAKLKVFSSAAASTGSAVRIATVLAELQQQSKSPDDVDKLIEQLKSSSELTAGKLTDINLIYKQYLNFVEGNFLNNDNQLNIARDSVVHTPFLKDCQLWVDGFAGFTTSELLLLTELLKVSASSKIALCIDPAALQEDWAGIFEPTQKTYTDLFSLIKTLKLPVEKPVILIESKRFNSSKALTHLEKNIFSFDSVPPVSSQGNIKITACAKTRLEVDYVARQICSLVREQDFRWRDIAVIASDIDEYRHYIQAVFSDFDIPFFIDRRRDLQQYPAVELITCALRIATDRFTTPDAINYLKSDLVPISRAEVDKLENYCLAFGVEGIDWLKTSKWDFAPAKDTDFSNEEIEKIRLKATEHLLQFRTRLQIAGAIDAEKFCAALFIFLDSLNVRGQLAEWTKAAFEAERLDEAQLHQQFFAQFTQLMDDFVFIFRNSSLSAKQYASIIGSAFSQMTVALIPPAIDQVLVGSIERSRHPDLKAVFLIGATQQQFPIPVYYDNILNDSDRKITSDAGFELSRTGSMQLIERRYLAYIAFTRPSRFLYITYPLADEKGSEVQPSFLVSQLETLFTDLHEEKYFGSSVCLNKSDLTGLLASRLGRDNLLPADDMDAKCKWLLDTAIKDYDLSKVRSAIDYKNIARLDNLPAQDILSTSATKLRSFASCPYQYFAKHILELQERRVFELEPFSLGLFFHKVLELLFNHLSSIDHYISEDDTDMLEGIVDNVVSKLLIEDSFLKSFNARTRHNSFIILSAAQMVKDAVLEFSQIASAGSFLQIAAETGFGDKFSLPAIEIKLENDKKLRIEGKIDRIDVVSQAGVNYCLVIDYKTSQTAINWSLFSAGLDLQLPIYLLAVRNQTVEKYKNLVPLGGFYFHIQVFSKSADLGEIEKKVRKITCGEPCRTIRKPKGIFNGEYFVLIDSKTQTGYSPFYSFRITQKEKQFGIYETSSLLTGEHFSVVLSFAENKIKEFGGRILSGVIDVNPYKYGKKVACTYCPYKSVCRFDWQINDYAQVTEVSKTEFFQAVE